MFDASKKKHGKPEDSCSTAKNNNLETVALIFIWTSHGNILFYSLEALKTIFLSPACSLQGL